MTFKSSPLLKPPPTIFYTQRAPCKCERHQSQQFFCVASGETLMGNHSICGLWHRNSNPVTLKIGTFRHRSTLPVISMDFQKHRKINNSNWHRLPDRPAMTTQSREQPDTAPRPGIVLPTPSSTIFSKYYIHQNLLIWPLAFQNHQLHNLLPLIPDPKTEAQLTPWGDMTRPREEEPTAIKLTTPSRKSMKVKNTKTKKQQQTNKANDKAISTLKINKNQGKV